TLYSIIILLINNQHEITRFPYTTLFRSLPLRFERGLGHGVVQALAPPGLDSPQQQAAQQPGGEKPPARRRRPPGYRGRSNQRRRSEEHTSELQSRENLVCRLLHEQKKT